MFGEELKHETISITADKIEYYIGKDESAYIKPIGKGWLLDASMIKSRNFFKDNIKNLNDLRDEYHSIGELYEFRKAYNALLFNEWAKFGGTHLEKGEKVIYPAKYDVHKSWKHHDGEDCFGGGWFIVVAMLPDGQITNHYKAEDWELFQIPVAEKAKYEYDGHTPADTLQRMNNLLKRK